MTILMISTMLLLVNASLIPTNDLPKADQEEGTDPRGLEKRVVFSWMKSLMRTKGNTNDVHTSNAHLEIPASVIVDPNVVQQKVSDIFKNLKYSVSFGETFAIAIKEGASVKHAEQLAYRFHDPSKDQFSQLDNWLNMKDSQAKEGIKEELLLNPHLQEFNLDNVLAWKGGLKPTHENLKNAINEKNPDVVKYLIGRGVKISSIHLDEALKQGNPHIVRDILKILTKNPNFIATEQQLHLAIFSGNLDIFKDIFKIYPKRGVTERHLDNAIVSGNPDIFRDILEILMKDPNFKVTTEQFNFALRRKVPVMVEILVKNGNYIVTGKDFKAMLQEKDTGMIETLVNSGAYHPNLQDVYYATYAKYPKHVVDLLRSKSQTTASK